MDILLNSELNTKNKDINNIISKFINKIKNFLENSRYIKKL